MLSKKQLFILIPTLVACSVPFVLEGAKISKKSRRKEQEVQQKVESPNTSHYPYSLKVPKGWQCIDDKTQLPQTVQMVFIGTSKGQFTPSINLATEKTEMPLEEYLVLAKKYHESQVDTKCRNLGNVETSEGRAELLQIDRKSQWGDIRFLQAALVKEGTAYVITTTCLLDEFAALYSQLLQAIQSFKIIEQTVEES